MYGRVLQVLVFVRSCRNGGRSFQAAEPEKLKVVDHNMNYSIAI